MSYKEINGDLIKLALDGVFDVIAHGCNCQAAMGAGIAPQMANTFDADEIDRAVHNDLNLTKNNRHSLLGDVISWRPFENGLKAPINLIVCNAYTQLSPGLPGVDGIPLDYVALQMCLRKMNYAFKGLTIGLPKIGCGLAGGNWEKVKAMIQSELSNCNVIVVNYEREKEK